MVTLNARAKVEQVTVLSDMNQQLHVVQIDRTIAANGIFTIGRKRSRTVCTGGGCRRCRTLSFTLIGDALSNFSEITLVSHRRKAALPIGVCAEAADWSTLIALGNGISLSLSKQ